MKVSSRPAAKDAEHGGEAVLRKLDSLRLALWTSTKQILPFLLLIAYSLLGSTAFFLMEKYGKMEPKYADPWYEGNCVDSENASFARAFYFTSTVFSSIGYGDVVPCTWPGKLLTLVLALTGVPLTLFCLGRLGKLLRKLLDRVWQRRCWCRPRSVEGREDRELPLTVGLLMALVWMVVSAAYFHCCMFADGTKPPSWTYFDAIYFTIISLFTIGFGDFAPTRRELTPVTFAFIFVGLSLVSMCVSIAQRKMETQFERIVDLIQAVYEDGPLRLGEDGVPDLSSLTGSDARAANVVLGLWKADPSGAWLNPLMAGPQADEEEKDFRLGRIAQGAVLNKWKSKTIARSVDASCQVEPLELGDAKAEGPAKKSNRLLLSPLLDQRFAGVAGIQVALCKCAKLSKTSTVSRVDVKPRLTAKRSRRPSNIPLQRSFSMDDVADS